MQWLLIECSTAEAIRDIVILTDIGHAVQYADISARMYFDNNVLLWLWGCSDNSSTNYIYFITHAHAFAISEI